MKEKYKCKLAKSKIIEDYEEDEINIHFIFEYDDSSVDIKSIANNVLATKLLTPMEFEGLEFLGKVDESYGAIANNNNYPMIEVVSNFEFRLVTDEYTLNGEICKEDLENAELASLKDLINYDVGFDVLFINKPPLVAKRIVIFIGIGGIVLKER